MKRSRKLPPLAAAAGHAIMLTLVGLCCLAAAAQARSVAAHGQRPVPARHDAHLSAAPCPNTNLMPAPGDLSTVAQATLCLINQQRREAGLPALTQDQRLNRAAGMHSEDMVRHGYFDHVSPGGSSPVARMTAVGYLSPSVGYAVGENIAWGTLSLATPAAIVTAWMHSPEHRANILRPEYRQSGLGIAAAAPTAGRAQAGATYTQDFGVLTR